MLLHIQIKGKHFREGHQTCLNPLIPLPHPLSLPLGPSSLFELSARTNQHKHPKAVTSFISHKLFALTITHTLHTQRNTNESVRPSFSSHLADGVPDWSPKSALKGERERERVTLYLHIRVTKTLTLTRAANRFWRSKTICTRPL